MECHCFDSSTLFRFMKGNMEKRPMFGRDLALPWCDMMPCPAWLPVKFSHKSLPFEVGMKLAKQGQTCVLQNIYYYIACVPIINRFAICVHRIYVWMVCISIIHAYHICNNVRTRMSALCNDAYIYNYIWCIKDTYVYMYIHIYMLLLPVLEAECNVIGPKGS